MRRPAYHPAVTGAFASSHDCCREGLSPSLHRPGKNSSILLDSRCPYQAAAFVYREVNLLPRRDMQRLWIRSGQVGNTTNVRLNEVSVVWDRSPRGPDGQLLLRQNALTYKNARILSAWVLKNRAGTHPVISGVNDYGSYPAGWSWDSLDSAARSRFNGKLRKGSASLGVTLGSWRQSRDMIQSRSANLAKRLSGVERRLERTPRSKRPTSESPADLVLEEKFGWEPLFSDLFGAMTVIASPIPEPFFVRSRAKGGVSYRVKGGSNPTTTQNWDGQAFVTCSAKVSVSNPNLWLLNRLGLINPATVIWDLIPWSFVVNMFVNVNAMISSVTDEVGLDISDIATTRTAMITLELFKEMGSTDPSASFTRRYAKTKTRTLGSLPTVHWQVQVPALNWDLAVTAGALVLQRFQRINRLLRVV